jgi:hypothetical protein
MIKTHLLPGFREAIETALIVFDSAVDEDSDDYETAFIVSLLKLDSGVKKAGADQGYDEPGSLTPAMLWHELLVLRGRLVDVDG